MGSSGCPARRTDSPAMLLGLLAACGACTVSQPPLSTFDAGVELPEGRGRDILVAECLNCHRLASLELFKGFYTRESWRSLVLTMRANGAGVDDAEVEVLTDYLARHFGSGRR